MMNTVINEATNRAASKCRAPPLGRKTVLQPAKKCLERCSGRQAVLPSRRRRLLYSVQEAVAGCCVFSA